MPHFHKSNPARRSPLRPSVGPVGPAAYMPGSATLMDATPAHLHPRSCHTHQHQTPGTHRPRSLMGEPLPPVHLVDATHTDTRRPAHIARVPII